MQCPNVNKNFWFGEILRSEFALSEAEGMTKVKKLT
jgi:hypothetical protein